MAITSLSFICFLALVLIIYYVLPKKLQWCVLLVASLAFYLLCGITGIIYISATAMTVYLATIIMQSLSDKTKKYIKTNKDTLTKETKSRIKKKTNNRKRLLLVIALIINFGFLGIFKYSHFFIDQINSFTGIIGLAPIYNNFSLIVPLGISYYTLQATGYLIDVYWGNIKAEKNPAKVYLFVTFFPQITQGPISEFGFLSKTLFEEHKFSYENFSRGFQRVLWGFWKKLLIADVLSPYVTHILGNYEECSGITCLIGAVLYMVQLYADFSGYMDIMCGYCEMLGIRLTENFDRPFFSKSVSEFWRRWHISLGAWLRKYIYYPVAMSKWNRSISTATRKLNLYISRMLPSTIALIFVWSFIGFWHDASWTYILWGLGNAFFIITSQWLEPVYVKTREKLHVHECSFTFRAFRVIRTFVIILLLEVLAAVGAMAGSGIDFMKRIFTDYTIPRGLTKLLPSGTAVTNLTLINLAFAASGIAIMFIVSLLQRKGSVRDKLDKIPFVIKIAATGVAIICLVAFGVEASWGAGAFMYANF